MAYLLASPTGVLSTTQLLHEAPVNTKFIQWLSILSSPFWEAWSREVLKKQHIYFESSSTDAKGEWFAKILVSALSGIKLFE